MAEPINDSGTFLGYRSFYNLPRKSEQGLAICRVRRHGSVEAQVFMQCYSQAMLRLDAVGELLPSPLVTQAAYDDALRVFKADKGGPSPAVPMSSIYTYIII